LKLVESQPVLGEPPGSAKYALPALEPNDRTLINTGTTPSDKFQLFYFSNRTGAQLSPQTRLTISIAIEALCGKKALRTTGEDISEA
jgi:hypothetical protein